MLKHARSARLLGCVCLVFVLAAGSGCTRQMRVSRHLKRGNDYYDKQLFHEASLEYLNVVRLDSTKPLVLERLAEIFHREGQLRQAFGFWRRAETVNPTNTLTRVHLAELSRFLGDLETARREALVVLDKEPGNLDALLILAQTSVKPEQIAEAGKKLEASRKAAGDQFQIHLASAILAANSGDQKKAKDELSKLPSVDPKSAQAWMALGALRWREGDLKQAGEAFTRAAQLAPNDPTAQLQLADFWLRTGHVDDAKKKLAELEKQAPDFSAAQLMSAKILLASRNYDEALAIVDKVLQKNRDDAEAGLLHAQLILAKGQGAAAVTELEHLRDKLPRVAIIHSQLARAYVATGQIAQALASARQAVQLEPNSADAVLLEAELEVRTRNFESATANLKTLLARNPNLVPGWALLEEVNRFQDRPVDAIAACQQWQKLMPKSAEPVYLMGLNLRRQGNNQEARNAFERARTLEPNYIPAFEQLVDLAVTEKRFDAAAALVADEIAKSPKAALPWAMKAKVDMARGDSTQTEADLRKALELQPEFDPAQLALGELYLRTKRPKDALTEFQAVLKRRPNNPAVLLQIGALQNDLGDYSKARESYEAVLKLQPNAVLALNNLAYLCVEKLNDLDAAYRYAQKARDIAPDNASVADTLGWVLCRRHDYPAAAALLETAAAKLGSQPDVQFHLATARYMMGDEAAAKTAFQGLVQSSQDLPGKAKAQERLWVLSFDPQSATPADVEKLKTQVKQEPDDVIAHLRVAEVFQKQNLLNDALEEYQAAVDASPKSVPLKLKLAEFYASAMHDSNKALDQAKVARDLAPDNPEVARVMGRLTYEAGQAKRAYYMLFEAARARPNDASLQFDLGQAAYAAGELNEAEQAMQRAATSNTSSGLVERAKQFLACAQAAKDPAQALQARSQTEQVLKSDPTCLPAMFALALASGKAGQPADERTMLENQILKRYPEFSPGWRELTLLYAGPLSDDRKALEVGAKARQLMPDDPTLSAVLGRIAYRQHDYKQAADLLGAATRSASTDPELLYELGMSYNQLKQTNQSREAFQKALALKLDPSKAQEARRILAQLH